MEFVWAAILGVVQGLTEFLPISSTAHLKLVPWLFGIESSYPVLASPQFDIALHAGSFVAIVLALWPDWVHVFSGALRGINKNSKPDDRFQLRLLGFLLLTSVPGAIAGVLLENQVEAFETPAHVVAGQTVGFHYAPLIIGVSIIVFGVLLWAVDTYMPRGEEMRQMTWLQALLIGVAQMVALVPGVSRSGATITAGRALGLKRDAIAKYSFMAAAPIIGGAAVFGLRHVPIATLFSGIWLVGFLAAAVTSVAAMLLMLGWVRKHSFAPFAVYRVAVGLLVIVVFFVRG
jgi:undecaprenyl-diphosphatase